MVNQQKIARVAVAALDRATDEVLTNFGSAADTGRWLKAMAAMETEAPTSEREAA